MTGIKVELSSLEADAARWSDVRAALREAYTTAETLSLHLGDVPQRDTDVWNSYNDLWMKVLDLIAGGTRESREIAAELRHVARILEGADAEAKAAMRGLWDLL